MRAARALWPALLPAFLLLLQPSGARGQGEGAAQPPIIVSSAPSSVAVTIYRDPDRTKGGSIEFKNEYGDFEYLDGYALIDEVREVDLPPGVVTLRFEGVASGILPQSAMMFDTDLAEKNFDSRLLSQRGLLDAFTGQSVTIRRTDKATGKQTNEQGTILSMPDGLILKTRHGYEAISCDGTLNTILYPGRPLDLTAKPTLSLTTRPDQKGGRVKLHLAYLASNFDWQANYVATFAPDGQSIDLTAWMTVASQDRTSFADADLSVIAGRVFRAQSAYDLREARGIEEGDNPYAVDNIDISSTCWPSGPPAIGGRPFPANSAAMEVELNRLPQFLAGNDDENASPAAIVVTGTAARRTELGDLKLYTVPQPTTVASQAMKQVRLIEHRRIKGDTLYRARYRDEGMEEGTLLFNFRNDAASGLGEPLPMGRVTTFQETRLGRQLVGESSLEDKAQDEQVDIKPSDDDYDVDIDFDEDEVRKVKEDVSRRRVTITNEKDIPILAEVEFMNGYYVVDRFSKPLIKRDGKRIWRVEVPAQSERSIDFTSTQLPDEDEDE